MFAHLRLGSPLFQTGQQSSVCPILCRVQIYPSPLLATTSLSCDKRCSQWGNFILWWTGIHPKDQKKMEEEERTRLAREQSMHWEHRLSQLNEVVGYVDNLQLHSGFLCLRHAGTNNCSLCLRFLNCFFGRC